MNVQLPTKNLFLTVEQGAARYNVSKDSIWRWKREGRFPAAVVVGPNSTRWRLSNLIEHESKMMVCFATTLEWKCQPSFSAS
ncbi:AlpA family transcriptional regulator [Paracoccus sp. SM22M-07]|uniref:helix-turn-helix transcriptional regulator n=1 Tax=Paracoccus sp. SM22M-07 TaxID=1520813 RepID=UPI000930A811|nr:helix-turn-helix domain-containing protein [Paracoccus sp. SM22M-07]